MLFYRGLLTSFIVLICTVGAAEPSALDHELLTHCAGQKEEFEVVQAKLAEGASPNSKSAIGETALHLACIYGHHRTISVLLAAGADPNARAHGENSLDMTPLSWCAYAGYTEAVETLLAGANGHKGADPNMVVLKEDGTRLTPLDIARSIGPRGEKSVKILINFKVWLDVHLSRSL